MGELLELLLLLQCHLYKAAGANVRAVLSLVQNGPVFCRSVFYTYAKKPEHLAEHLHRLGDGAGAFAGAAFTKYIFRVSEPPYILVLSGGCHSGAKR